MRGTFRVRGDTLEIFPAYEEHRRARRVLGRRGRAHRRVRPAHRRDAGASATAIDIYPASTSSPARRSSRRRSQTSRPSWRERLSELQAEGKLLEAQRLEQRTHYDLEMLRRRATAPASRTTRATCPPPARRAPGHAARLLPRRLPAVRRREPHLPAAGARHVRRRPRAQADADRLRLPPALGRRQPPAALRRVRGAYQQAIYVSATPGPYELRAQRQIVEQIIRPTGLVDPTVEVRPTEGQVDDLMGEVQAARRPRASACWSRP